MQAEFPEAMAELRPWLDHPDRTFWHHHFYAEALKALNCGAEAVEHYRQSIADGSTFCGTICQLLLALHRIKPALAVEQLQQWPLPLPGYVLEGAQQAASLTAGLELAEWLQSCGLASAAITDRLAAQRLYNLQPLATVSSGGSLEAVQQRLHQLGLSQLV